MELNDQFRRAFEFANETNRCIFLTGKAGTGKTTLLRYIKENCYKQITVLAPTGVAAIQAGGSTIHSFFQLPFSPFVPPVDKTRPSEQSNKLMASTKLNAARRSVIRQLDLLILDEISMVRCDILDAIDVMLRIVRRKSNLPFGGVQVMFIGDMYQLPPVVQDEEWKILSNSYASPFFFDAKVVSEVNPVYIELEKIYRQNDKVFVDLLNKVRNNQLDDETITLLNTRFVAQSQKDIKTVSLVTHNYMADTINQQELARLEGPSFIYKATVSGTFPEKSYPTDEKIELKLGTRVMFVKNDTEKRYFNGKLGIVHELSQKSIRVLCDGELEPIEVKVEQWDNIQYKLDKTTNTIQEEELGSFAQYPLRLAWAITIHKSQGLTFDQVEIDAEKAFSNGQVYVALSRCRTLEGIRLRSKINPNSLQNHEKVVRFAERKQSAEVVEAVLVEGKRSFQQKVLLEIYNLQEFSFQSQELLRLCHTNSGQLDRNGMEWVEKWNNDWVDLAAVSRKFEIQLLQLFDGLGSGNLEDRLEKASVFFKAQLKGKIEELKVNKIVTESKETAKDINLLLEEIWRGLWTKYEFITQCGKDFRLEDFMKTKNNLQLPGFSLNVYATQHKDDTSGIPYPELYEALRDIRDSVCEEENLPIFLVANKKSLIQMCSQLPLNKNELLRIKGFGTTKVESIGPRFLQAIASFVAANGIERTAELPEAEPKGRPKKEKKEKKEKQPKLDKVDTYALSYNMFKALGSVEKVASVRELAQTTIAGHLARYVGSGDLDIDTFVEKEKQQFIRDHSKNWEPGLKMNEMKTLLGDTISYADLRFYLAKFPVEKEVNA
jgi:hypothetical protein